MAPSTSLFMEGGHLEATRRARAQQEWVVGDPACLPWCCSSSLLRAAWGCSLCSLPLAPQADQVGTAMKWKLSPRQRTPGLSCLVPGRAPRDEACVCFLTSCLVPSISRYPGRLLSVRSFSLSSLTNGSHLGGGSGRGRPTTVGLNNILVKELGPECSLLGPGPV